MKRIKNSTIVGIFVLAASFLGMSTIIFVASMKLFRAEETLLVYFDESVNGLSVGAAVKYKGVPIGKVKNIMISYNQPDLIGSSFIPVFLEIDLTKVGRKQDEGITINFDNPVEIEQIINDGIRAKLQLASFITGQLFVELDYFVEPESSYKLIQLNPEFVEIPSVPSDMKEFGTTASDIMAQFASLNIKGIGDQFSALLEKLDNLVAELDVSEMSHAVVNTADSISDTLESMQLDVTMEEFRDTLTSLRSAAVKMESVIDPAVDNYHETLDNINDTLQSGNRVLENLDDLTRSDGSLRHELLDTLDALKQAARSADELMSYLERNPKALLSGREQP